MEVFERIASERKKLGFSQAEFASRAEVSLSTQKRYEKGERDPDVSYLKALGNMGVDVGYLLSGVRVTDDLLLEKLAMQAVIYRLQKALRIDPTELDALICEGVRSTQLVRSGQMTVEAEDFPDRATAIVDKWVRESVEVDSKLLAEILCGVDQAKSSWNKPITTEKTAQVAAILYRSFKSNGKVSPTMIEETVKLAAD